MYPCKSFVHALMHGFSHIIFPSEHSFQEQNNLHTKIMLFNVKNIGHHVQLYSKLAFLSLDVVQVHIQACLHANNEEIVCSLEAQCNSEESP